MKKLFKKAATVLGSALMVGATVGMAAAAAYPAPFVQGGAADVAIVYGSNAAISDAIGAANIQANLATALAAQTASGTTTTGTTVTGGDAVTLQRPSSLLHVGSGLSDVFGRSVTDNDMPTLLADGIFRDSSNNDHDYTQKINVANLTLQQFDLSDYDSSADDNTPVIGIPLESDANVLNYTLSFQDNVNMTKMADKNLEIMGKKYYVLSTTSNTTITMLDSGVSTSLSGDETTTVTVGDTPYEVSVSYIDSNNVKLTVNGETTDSLAAGDTYKLEDGSYVGIKTILSQGYSGGTSQVDFSIGSGKLEIKDGGANVKVNGDTVNGLTSDFTLSSGLLSDITLQWNTEDDVAFSSDESITMPTFSSVKLSFGGMTYPATEKTVVDADGSNGIKIKTTLKNGDISLSYLNNRDTANFTTIGKDSTHMLETSPTTSLTFDGSHSGSRFVVSWKSGKDAESYLLSATSFTPDNGVNKTTIKSEDGGNLNQDVQEGDSITLGNVVLTIGQIDDTANTVALTANSGSTFDKIYTKEGLQIQLPWTYTTNITTDTACGANATGAGLLYYSYYTNTSGTAVHCTSTAPTYNIQFAEEDKDGVIAGGSKFNVTLASTATDHDAYVSTVTGAGSYVEQQSTNVNQYTVSSALATEIEHDTDPTQKTADITYHGGESYGTVLLTSADATVTPGTTTTTDGTATELGAVTVKDSEVSSVSGKNLVVIGGSCINSVAADLLGETACGEAFTDLTGVSAGGYLIQSFDRSGKVALLVAGYEAADTTKAVTYLTNNAASVDTTVNKKYTGTTATEATEATVEATTADTTATNTTATA